MALAGVRRRGKGWQAYYRDPSGRERTKMFARQKDASDWRAERVLAMRLGSWLDPRRSHVRLRNFADGWLDGRTDLRATTRSKYRRLLDHHILPALGDAFLDQLDATTVRAWHMALRGRLPPTSSDAYRLLRAIFNTAIYDGVVASSPCRVKGGGTDHAAERPIATIAEVNGAVAVTAPRHRTVVLLAAWCSLRRGEIAGLQRRDVDELHSQIHVRRSITVTSEGKVIVGPPKTPTGVRDVQIPPHVLVQLVLHLRNFVDPEPTAPLFTGVDGAPLTPRSVDRVWERARRAIGRSDLTLHDLRHSGQTWASATGATTAELMHRAGHKTPAAGLRYQQASQERDRALAPRLSVLASEADAGRVDDVPLASAVSAKPRGLFADFGPNGLWAADSDTKKTLVDQLLNWQPQRDSNPCLHLERVVS